MLNRMLTTLAVLACLFNLNGCTTFDKDGSSDGEFEWPSGTGGRNNDVGDDDDDDTSDNDDPDHGDDDDDDDDDDDTEGEEDCEHAAFFDHEISSLEVVCSFPSLSLNSSDDEVDVDAAAEFSFDIDVEGEEIDVLGVGITVSAQGSSYGWIQDSRNESMEIDGLDAEDMDASSAWGRYLHYVYLTDDLENPETLDSPLNVTNDDGAKTVTFHFDPDNSAPIGGEVEIYVEVIYFRSSESDVILVAYNDFLDDEVTGIHQLRRTYHFVEEGEAGDDDDDDDDTSDDADTGDVEFNYNPPGSSADVTCWGRIETPDGTWLVNWDDDEWFDYNNVGSISVDHNDFDLFENLEEGTILTFNCSVDTSPFGWLSQSSSSGWEGSLDIEWDGTNQVECRNGPDVQVVLGDYDGC